MHSIFLDGFLFTISMRLFKHRVTETHRKLITNFLCLRDSVFILSIELLPNHYPVFRSHIHRIFLCDVEGLVERLYVADGGVYTPFA